MKGSIRKRGSSWQGRIDVGLDPETGKRRIRYVTRPTKREVQAELAALATNVRKGEYVEPTRRTFGEWMDVWFETAIDGKKRPRTCETYRSVIDVHLKPRLGHVLLQHLQATDIELYYKESSLAASTLQMHQAILHSALSAAERKGLVHRNVAKLVEGKPRARRTSDDVRANCWEAEEARVFLKVAQKAGPQQAAFYTLALEAGLRKGELAGVKWQDLDLEGARLAVVRQLLKPGSAPLFGPPKNGEARTLDLTAELVELLRVHRTHQAELKMRNRRAYREHGLVFAKEWRDVSSGRENLGDPLQINNIGQREFARLLEASGVRRIKFHGLRHTAATLALRAGVDPKDVQVRLGHKRIEITLNVYAHALPSYQKEAAKRIGALLHG